MSRYKLRAAKNMAILKTIKDNGPLKKNQISYPKNMTEAAFGSFLKRSVDEKIIMRDGDGGYAMNSKQKSAFTKDLNEFPMDHPRRAESAPRRSPEELAAAGQRSQSKKKGTTPEVIPQPIQLNTSATAESVMDGIAMLVEENSKLRDALTLMRNTIDGLLNEGSSNGTDTAEDTTH